MTPHSPCRLFLSPELANIYDDEVNLSSEWDSDREIEGWLGVFGLPRITQIPSVVFGKTVVKLYLKKNQLASLPPDIGKLKALRIMDVSENQLEKLPSEIGQCTSLENLDLSENALQSICPEFGQLTNLQRLICFKNGLKTLPDEICSCVALKANNPPFPRARTLVRTTNARMRVAHIALT